MTRVILSHMSSRGKLWPQKAKKVKKIKEMQHGIPSFYAVRCSAIALDSGFRAVRRAKVFRQHEDSRWFLGRPRHSPSAASRNARSAHAGLASRDFHG